MSDLDNEELEATKRILKNPMTNRYIEIEKSADEMFEELGYKKYLSDKKGILFFYIRSSDLNANEMERIIFYKNKTVGFDYVYCNFSKDISMQELQAINKKCQELRMDMKVKFKYYIKIIGIWIRVPKKIFFSRIAGYFYCMQKGEWLDE